MNKSWLLGAALLLSLAGNAFFGGWWLTRAAHPEVFSHTLGDPTGPRLKQLMGRMQQLPTKQRQLIREKMRALAPQMRELAKAGREQHHIIEQLLQAPQLDSAQLQAAFARQHELQGKMQDLRQQMVIDIASSLPPKERAQLFTTRPGQALEQ